MDLELALPTRGRGIIPAGGEAACEVHEPGAISGGWASVTPLPRAYLTMKRSRSTMREAAKPYSWGTRAKTQSQIRARTSPATETTRSSGWSQVGKFL